MEKRYDLDAIRHLYDAVPHVFGDPVPSRAEPPSRVVDIAPAEVQQRTAPSPLRRLLVRLVTLTG